MYFLALITDYDGTLAHHGVVAQDVIDALKRFKESGRRVVLVTGRELADLRAAFPEEHVFDLIVAENGAVLYNPATREEQSLAPAPHEAFVAKLRELGVAPLSIGRSIVATWEPNDRIVLEVIRELGLELQIVFNKGAVMVLPPNVNKATGILAAMAELEISAHNTVGVGDAENDHAFLKACGCAAAVQNALPTVKESADIVLERANGAGVVELIERMMRNDGRLLPQHRHGLLLGTVEDENVWLDPQHGSVLIAGPSGAGKSTIATALTERMAEQGFQFCVFDPEGDYQNLEHTVPVGDASTPPKEAEVLQLLRQVSANVVINMQAVKLADRPMFFAKLLGGVLDMRNRLGRPHWLVIDEAHHLLPAARDDAAAMVPERLGDAIFLTVHPDAMAPAALRTVKTVIALGRSPTETLMSFTDVIGEDTPVPLSLPDENGDVLFWNRMDRQPPRAAKAARPHQDRKRHTRKYAEGELGHDRSFYFRGPRGELNLRAQNLLLFLQIAEGVDLETWTYHLQAGDYSSWFRHVIKDEQLAAEAAAIESDRSLTPDDSRRRIADAVSRRYTAPAAR